MWLVDDVEFRLGRGFRTRALAAGCVGLGLAAVLLLTGIQLPALRWMAILPLAFAAGSFAVWARRRQLSTRLTPQGIEIRRYRRRLVPWQAISGIETVSHEHVRDVAAYNFSTHDARGRGSRTVAAVRITRASGHPIQLPAPLVTDSQDDPGFDDKVRLIRARWQQAVTGTGG
jgi:hypothetical protein